MKPVIGSIEEAACRLEIISKMREKDISLFPEIYKNGKGSFFFEKEGYPHYYMEYLPSDGEPVITSEFLEATGKLHEAAKDEPIPKNLKRSKWDEYQNRSDCFCDPWFSLVDPELFSGHKWKIACKHGRFFSSKAFKDLYDRLPKQLIHGDNNQTNIIKYSQKISFIDFDAFRYDNRLLDLASYFRYGGFRDYIQLSKESCLNLIQRYYGRYAGPLSLEEEKMLPSIVMFSHIEFLAFTLKTLQEHVGAGDLTHIRELKILIKGYLEQIETLDSIL